MSSSNSEHQTKRECQQLLRLHERLLSDFQGAREELSAPGTDGLVKVIKARTGSSPELAPVKTAVEEAIRALKMSESEIRGSNVEMTDSDSRSKASATCPLISDGSWPSAPVNPDSHTR